MRATKKTSKKNIDGKIFFISRNELGFFSKCFFYFPKLTSFSENRQQSKGPHRQNACVTRASRERYFHAIKTNQFYSKSECHNTQDACVKRKSRVSRAILTRHATKSNQEWFYRVSRGDPASMTWAIRYFPIPWRSLQSVKMLFFSKFLQNLIFFNCKKYSDLPITVRTSQSCIQFEDGRMDRGVYVVWAIRYFPIPLRSLQSVKMLFFSKFLQNSFFFNCKK